MSAVVVKKTMLFLNRRSLTVTLIMMGIAMAAVAQTNHRDHNYVVINPGDSYNTIISKAAHVTPSPRQLRWQQLELVAFLHFGINTFTGREWGTGKEDPRLFDPTHLDADQWIRVLKKAGFKQVILTAKHHDGFCLWPSAYTEHSVKNSPWKNGKGDVVREVADACRKYHIGFGVYLSPWDRNCPFYGDSKKYNRYFENQLTELLTHYGKIDEVWFDGANGTGPNGKKPVYDFDAWYKLIRKLQPGAVIAVMGPDVRWVGTETGYGRKSEWSVVPVGAKLQQNIAAGSQHDLTFKPSGDMTGKDLGSRSKILGAKALIWYPAEADVSIRPGWFYHASQDSLVKSPQKLMDIYYGSVGRNCVLLLNVPPDKEGLINQHDIKHLMAWKKLVQETFSTNLAAGAVIRSPNGAHAKALLDHDNSTYWTTRGKDTTAAIEFNLQGTKTFDVLLLQEEIRVGQRIEKFELDYWNGQGWKEVTAGTTVGYKRLLRFKPITTGKVRLTIASSRLNPMLAEFGLFKQAAASPAPVHWKMVWQDEFSKDGKPDSSKWTFAGRGRSDWNCYCADNDSTAWVNDGKLYLSGILSKEASDTAKYQTGCISTKGKFSFKYGKLEVRAKLPRGQGTWPAIWLLPATNAHGGWPDGGEIDVMEHLNFDSIFYQTIHSAYIDKLHHRDDPKHHGTATFKVGQFNVFGMQWSPDRIDLLINGKKTFSYPRIESDTTKTQWPFDQPFYILLDQALGGNWPGQVNKNDLPAKMVVDWVRVYQDRE